MALAAVASHRIGGLIPVGPIFKASARIGQMRRGKRKDAPAIGTAELRVLQ
jgi:hypothetical protein